MFQGIYVSCASEDDYQKVQYFQDIVVTLQSVKYPGSFAAGGTMQLPFPALQISGFSEKIGLPINSLQVGKVVEKCSRAPFGRGEDTIVDNSVRNTWQLNPSQFSIGNQREWEKELKSLVDRVKTELGCDATQDVTCELYKLLLYEPGGFFKSHRDTEKANGMFGMLVVQLPSDYSGGQLVVPHRGHDKVFDFSGIKGCTNLHYAAFCADCQHELKMVTKGYRLCLIYNLIYSGPGSLPAPIEDTLVISQLIKAMQLWNDEALQHKGPPMMAYILEHKYCQASLSFKGLKNIDRAVGDMLTKACQEANFDLYLTHVSRAEMWSASCNRNKFELEEQCDDCIDASHLISPQGNKPAHFSEMLLDNGAMVPLKEKYKLTKPDEEERSEATGNEGASVERWYKWTALIFWPQKKRLMNIGCDKMTNKLKINLTCRSTPLTAAEEECMELARELVESDGHTSTSAVTLLQCLHNLDQIELIHEFLSCEIDAHIMINAGFRKEAFSLCDSCVGWEVMRPCARASWH